MAEPTNNIIGSRGRQAGEPDERTYPLTTGPVLPQRPGGLPGSTTGSRGDTGRDGVTAPLAAPRALPPHTGY